MRGGAETGSREMGRAIGVAKGSPIPPAPDPPRGGHVSMIRSRYGIEAAQSRVGPKIPRDGGDCTQRRTRRLPTE